MDYAQIIKDIGRGSKGARDLNRDGARALFADLLAGRVPELELGAIMLSLRIKGETADELAGFSQALAAATQTITPPAGPRVVVLPTYNGGRKEANLMPLVAQLLAREGVPVLIQGRHDFETRTDPFTLLAALDLYPASDLAGAKEQLTQAKLAVAPVDLFCPGLVNLLALRPRLGVRNVAHTLAKFIDPCPGHSVRVIPMTHPHFLTAMQDMLTASQATALLMRGTEGEAYANPRRRPEFIGFVNGEKTILAEAEAMTVAPEAQADCSVDANAALIRAMLAGTVPIPQPVLDQVAAIKSLAIE